MVNTNEVTLQLVTMKVKWEEAEEKRSGKLYLHQFVSVSTNPIPTPQFSSVQSLGHVRLFETQWIAASQASLSITNCWSLLKLMPIESVMPSRHLILCRPLLLLPPIPPSIKVFSNESTLRMRWYCPHLYPSLNLAASSLYDPGM